MLAMYATFGLVFMTALDPVVLAPLVVALMFVLGVSVYAGIIRYAMRARANPGMVQIFATFGLALLIQGLAQYFFTPDYRSIANTWLRARRSTLPACSCHGRRFSAASCRSPSSPGFTG
jgi:branched-chain amino acid transport system permease protein